MCGYYENGDGLLLLQNSVPLMGFKLLLTDSDHYLLPIDGSAEIDADIHIGPFTRKAPPTAMQLASARLNASYVDHSTRDGSEAEER